MATWNKLGITYGNISAVNYSSATTEIDLDYLKNLGFTKLRVAQPWYNDTASVAFCKDIVTRAIAKGFYVVWGTTPPRPFTGTNWTNYLASLNSLAVWAQSVGSANFQLSLGNEEEAYNNGSGAPTDAVVRDDIIAKASELASVYTLGAISFEATSTDMPFWAALSRGSLIIGINVYNTLSGFKTDVASVISNFGSTGYISEWSDGGVGTYGYTSNHTEELFRRNIRQRLQILKESAIVSAYFFCFNNDGGFGLTEGNMNIKRSSGEFRLAFQTLAEGRPWFIHA